MPCPHNEITIVQRSQRQSAVAAAAYQSGEKLFCEYDQQVKHYPEKRGIVHNEILLPANILVNMSTVKLKYLKKNRIARLLTKDNATTTFLVCSLFLSSLMVPACSSRSPDNQVMAVDVNNSNAYLGFQHI